MSYGSEESLFTHMHKIYKNEQTRTRHEIIVKDVNYQIKREKKRQ